VLHVPAAIRRGFVPGLKRPLFRSAGVRFGMIFAGLFALGTLALAVFLWWSTAGLLDRQTDAAINADTQGLSERYAEGGLLALEETIEQRLAANVDDDAIYLLVDPAYRKLVGNLERWPPNLRLDADWYQVAIERAGRRGMARLHHFELPGGFHLLVGRDVEAHAQMARLLTDALLWACGVALLLGIIGALAVRSLFRMTLADVSATAAAISAGDLTRRVRVSGRGDEFDRLAETINDMLDRIARLMDGVRQVSNAIAHDLRTPIARARARLEDAAEHAVGEADLRAAIERAEADLDGVIAIFQALLRIAEIEAGARRSAFAELDLAPLLLDLVDLYGAVAEERGQHLVPSIPPHLPAYGDRDMIQQAVANLLDNALKFSPTGGSIWLSGAAEPGHGTRITVADQGPGIPPADRARAAERFFRGESARSTPGSGLGLSLVQAVATLHGGTLLLEDNGPGLRATLVLNTATGAALPGPHVTATSSADQRPAEMHPA
jgi:signal transduction histidine kinase